MMIKTSLWSLAAYGKILKSETTSRFMLSTRMWSIKDWPDLLLKVYALCVGDIRDDVLKRCIPFTKSERALLVYVSPVKSSFHGRGAKMLAKCFGKNRVLLRLSHWHSHIRWRRWLNNKKVLWLRRLKRLPSKQEITSSNLVKISILLVSNTYLIWLCFLFRKRIRKGLPLLQRCFYTSNLCLSDSKRNWRSWKSPAILSRWGAM